SNSLSVQFAVTVPSQPLVKLNSNVSSVNNGTTAVVLTASVISGSGPTPLFTFALDRNFVKLLQAESSKTTLAVASQLLESGDNWIYIKMKTSESCFTAINAVDSVKIIRNSVTGIVDINFPTIVITAYPNPFGPDVTIKGLQSSARYKLELLDASGKKLYDKDVSNQSTVTFHNSGLKSGQYIIRIYDSKKRRLIGSIPLLHL
ncbi:MAG TPA: T9SS type A sorting domain-containing protein, partial [Flavitalea sp.]|nr:T9SS type A sorting domain-containing protein [Flavitalea sp.]